MDKENTKERQPIGAPKPEEDSPVQESPKQTDETKTEAMPQPEADKDTPKQADKSEKQTDNAENAQKKSEEKSSEESKAFISDFAPEPIVIPNYNAEKEHKKRRKEKVRDQKKLSQSRKKELCGAFFSRQDAF